MTYYILTFIAGLLVGVCFKYRFVRALIHVDKEFNDELLNGRSGETISTRAGRALIFKQRGGSPRATGSGVCYAAF